MLLSLLKKQKYDEALEHFNKTIKLSPNDKLAYFNKGIVLFLLKEYNAAIEFFNKTIELDPNYSDEDVQ